MSGGKQAAAKPAGRSRIWLAGLACGALVTMATPTACLGAALLLPAMLTWFTDEAPGRPVARCLLLFGIAGSLPSLVALWRGPGNLGAALEMALDMHTVAQAWALQALGWLLAEGLPLAGLLVVDAQMAHRTRIMRAKRDRLAEEWSLPPAEE